jgi:hypothetical protein
MNTPLRDEIAKICEQHFPIATVKAELEADVPKSKLMETIINHEVNKVIDRAVDQIIDLVASKMPEKKPLMDGNKHLISNATFNEAIDSVKSILKGGTDEIQNQL